MRGQELLGQRVIESGSQFEVYQANSDRTLMSMLSSRRRAAVPNFVMLGQRWLALSPSPYLRALSTKPPLSSRPPNLYKAPPPGPKAPRGNPPPPAGPEPPAQKASGGFGLGAALGMIVLAGGTAATGYYYVLADQNEKSQMEGYLAKVKSTVGLAPPLEIETPPTGDATSNRENEVKNAKGDVEAATAGAAASVKTELQKATTRASQAVHAVEEKVATALRGGKEAPTSGRENSMGASVKKGGAEDGDDGGAELSEKVKEAAGEVEGEVRSAVENAEHLAAQIISDIEDRAKKEEDPGAVATEEGENKTAGAPTESALGRKQAEAALKHFAGYESRGKELRFDTLTRAAEEALAQGEALRNHLEQTLLKDLAVLSNEALQLRVVQLVGELQERTKWEALRLHEAVRKAEMEVSGKYVELIRKLREESVEEVGRQSRALEAEKQVALLKAMEEKDKACKTLLEEEMRSFTGNVTAAFEQERAQDRALVEAQAKRELENVLYERETGYQAALAGRLEELGRLKGEVEALEAVFETDTDYEHVSWKVHRVSAALLAFELALQSSQPLRREIAALQHVTKGDPVLDAVLAGLPPAASEGVPTPSELQVRFPMVQKAAREAAFVPESSPGMVGHMFAGLLAAVTIQPRGLVEGSGADETLARAAYHVERGHLAEAVQELEGLGGLAGRTVEDWLQDARGRLELTQAARAMNARSALLNVSMV